MGYCPARKVLPWVGSTSPLPIFATIAHTGHAQGLTSFLLLRKDSSLVFLPPSPPPISVPAAGGFCVQPTQLSLRFFSVPTEDGTGTAADPAAATTVAQSTPFSRSSTLGTDSVAATGPTVSAPVSPGTPAPQTAKLPSDRISTRTRQRTAIAAGIVPHAADYGFGPGGAARTSARCPTATAQSLRELLSYDFRLLLETCRLHLQS